MKHYDVQAGGSPIPLEVTALMVLFFLCGLYSIAAQVFKFGEEGAAHWFGGAAFAMLFGVFCFIVAWNTSEGWTSSVPFMPQKAKSAIGRTLFALGGIGCQVLAVTFFRKAMRKYRAAHPREDLEAVTKTGDSIPKSPGRRRA